MYESILILLQTKDQAHSEKQSVMHQAFKLSYFFLLFFLPCFYYSYFYLEIPTFSYFFFVLQLQQIVQNYHAGIVSSHCRSSG